MTHRHRIIDDERGVRAIVSEPVPAKYVCGKHWCQRPGEEPHPCPYQHDIHDDNETKCTCCEACTQDCADDI